MQISNLLAETDYVASVRGLSFDGDGEWSDDVEFSTIAAPPMTAVPDTMSLENSILEANAITIQWLEPNDNGSAIINYDIEITDQAFWSDDDTYYDLAPTLRHQRIPDLAAATDYTVRIRATNNDGDGAWSSATVLRTREAGSDPEIDTPAVSIHSDFLVTNMVAYKNQLYIGFGRNVLRFDEGSDTFVAIRESSHSYNALGISPADDLLVLGFVGGGYETFNGNTTWRVFDTNDPDGQPLYPGGPYATLGNRLWAIRNGNTVSSTVSVVGTTGANPAWIDYTPIGPKHQPLTNIYSVNDTIVVGAADGLYVYNRVDNFESEADRFRNISPEFQFAPSPENYRYGGAFLHRLYLNTRRGFVRTDGRDLYEDITYYFNGPQLQEFGGPIQGFAVDAHVGYILMRPPYINTALDFQTWLLVIDDFVDVVTGQENLAIRPIQFFSVGDIRSMYTFHSQETGHTHLFMVGQQNVNATSIVPIAWRMRLACTARVAQQRRWR